MLELPKIAADANHTLERADRIENHEERAKAMKRSFDELASFLKGSPSAEQAEYIENRKRTYLRSHMLRLSKVNDPDHETWFWNLILFVTAKAEVDHILTELPDLRPWYDRFEGSCREWVRTVLAPTLERRGII